MNRTLVETEVAARPDDATRRGSLPGALPLLVAALAGIALFREPASTLLRDWWTNPEAAHGLLLGPLSVWLAWRRGLIENPRAQRVWGTMLLTGAVALRYVSGLAAELFTMRMSLLIAVAALIVFVWGFRQLRHWWLPATLLVLSVPLPAIVLSSLAFPLQMKASQLGAALLEMRHVPVVLAGNVIHLPGRSLFVTEACSGLRSLTALTALGVLVAGLFLRSPWLRAALLAITLPLAVLLNGVRVFLTGFLVYFVSPALGEGFMHYTEGWVIFVVAFLGLGSVAWVFAQVERIVAERRSNAG